MTGTDSTSPYGAAPARAFWKTGVVREGGAGLSIGPYNHETAQNNIIVSNHGGINNMQDSNSANHHNLVWGNSTDYQNTSPGTGCLSANPLYVSTSNWRLTSNSPSRYSASDNSDLGPLPYTTDPTPGLYGTLWAAVHLDTSGSPYTVGGDITVPPGVTLTIDPGVELQFATSDLMGRGTNTSEVELIVEGTLVATGGGAAATLRGGHSTALWNLSYAHGRSDPGTRR